MLKTMHNVPPLTSSQLKDVNIRCHGPTSFQTVYEFDVSRPLWSRVPCWPQESRILASSPAEVDALINTIKAQSTSSPGGTLSCGFRF